MSDVDQKAVHNMQLSLAYFGTVAAGIDALGKQESDMPAQEGDGGLKPIEIIIPQDDGRTGVRGILHNAADFLIISITGCEPKGD